MTRPKRLAFILPNLKGGGAERVALSLVNEFAADGYAVDLVLAEAEGELIALLDPRVRVVDLRAKRLRSALFPLVRYLRDARPAGVQALMWPITAVTAAAHRLARSKSRLILSDHTLLSRHYRTFGRLQAWVLRSSIRIFYPTADARIVVSKGAADDLARLSGISRDSIEVIYNPVGRPRENDPEELASWATKEGRILTVGTLKPEKNQELLIRAFGKLLHDRAPRSAQLTIVGEGPMRTRLEAVAIEEGVADHVRFAGFELDPWRYYLSADLFVLSSDYEGFALVLIEAMRVGLPVVSTDCESGPREILDGGRFGTLVPCGDADGLSRAMQAALNHPHDRDALEERAISLSGDHVGRRYLELMSGET